LETRRRAPLRRLGHEQGYVIGLAFLAAGFSSLPIILAVCALTGLVGIKLHRDLAAIFLMAAAFIRRRDRRDDCSRWLAPSFCWPI